MDDYRKYLGNTELPSREKDESGDVPMFCPRCEEIRGVDGVLMSTVPQRLMWKSFGMCQDCLLFQRQHPEQVEENKKKWKENLLKKEAEIKRILDELQYRVYYEEYSNDPINRMPSNKFVKSVTNEDFPSYGPAILDASVGNDKPPYAWLIKSKKLFNEQRANEIVEILKKKGFTAWTSKET